MTSKLCIATLLLCVSTAAQTPAPQHPAAFEVVSIRPSKPGSNWRISWTTTPDGYRVTGQSLRSTILIAYIPQGMSYWSKDRISGAPSWIDDLYDIDAKVSEADLAEWQKQGITPDKKPVLREMLQALLADRCHLVTHRIPGPPINGFSLEPGKRGPQLTASPPDETYPQGMKLVSGGVLVPYQRGEKPRLKFYGATMADFANQLSQSSGGHPVLDHTGLTGRYDFALNWVEDPDSKLPEGVISTDDPDPLSHWDVEGLGFRRIPIKLPADTLVIDHIEKPSEN